METLMITEADLVPGALLSHAKLGRSRMPAVIIGVVFRTWLREHDTTSSSWELYVLPLSSSGCVGMILINTNDFVEMTRLA